MRCYYLNAQKLMVQLYQATFFLGHTYIGIQIPTINDLIYYWVIKFVLSFLIHFFTTLINISTITKKKNDSFSFLKNTTEQV